MTLHRLKIIRALFLLLSVGIITRLFYWQVLASDSLAKLAQIQHSSRNELPAQRGQIYTSDNFPLVQNQDSFLVYAYLPDMRLSPEEIADKLANGLATDSAQFSTKLTRTDTTWVPLVKKLSPGQKESLAQLNLSGVGFDMEPIRLYPEASTAAHLLGFLGSNAAGQPQGYFGLEGFYDLELRGRPGRLVQERDAAGRPIPLGNIGGFPAQDGRSLKLHLNRAIQLKVEDLLRRGIDRYGAVAGEVAIMDPRTGAVLALAAWPQYDPLNYAKFDNSLYPNPLVASAYEPGSTFKVLSMAAAIDAGVVKPDTRCDICAGPLQIDKYTIKTWNNEYHPDITMTEVIQRSDNIGMVFVGQQLGQDKLWNYLDKFGIGQPTGIDLQEEATPKLRPKSDWSAVDLATASFGQGIALTGMQMLTAVSVIANGGELVEPHLVDQVLGDRTLTIPAKTVRRVIAPQTARIITDMMVNAVNSGEAQWTKIKGYKIAGKTGTAQIPVAGHYDEEKTIASFIGFAPADNPQFAMLVKLREPQSSPWAAETAAPLWMSLARFLFLYLNIPPDSP
jgi:cell division protein FtsI (penicillin-binding protein 3)